MNQYIRQGEKFLNDCLFEGLAHSYDVIEKKYKKPYPEVTGYLLEYFGKNNNISPKLIDAADYLVELQDVVSGGWPSFFNKKNLYTFDTSQIVIGLCEAYRVTGDDKYRKSAEKGGQFLKSMQLENGAFVPIYDCIDKEGIVSRETYKDWNGPFSGLMCKLTEGYKSLFDITGDKEYIERINLTAKFYSNSDPIEYTHPMSYWLEGLYEAGNNVLVDNILLKKVIPNIRDNGYIPYTEDLPYAYVSGTIQLGIMLYKLGYKEYAKKIRDYGRLVQSKHSSGGLFQYANENGNLDMHVHTEINSWGTKYFCQLERMIECETVNSL